jgi:hypothetical protein
VPDMEMALLPLPRGKWGWSGGGGEAGPCPLERGKDRQLKSSEGRDNMERIKKNSPFGRDGGGSA